MAKIYINQSGYLLNGTKRAVMIAPAKKFDIVDDSGKAVFSGKVQHFGNDEYSGDDVYTADFSEFNSEGTFTLRADNGEISEQFVIGTNSYDKLFGDVSKAYYYLRCGCGLEEKYAGVYKHGKCHHTKAVLWEDNSVEVEASGGWHDAGDYGRYVTAGAVALAHILYSYVLFPKAFEKQNLNIPESENDIPDMLSECRYELEWLLKMQRADGGVYHKLTTKGHAAFVMPEEDKEQLYLLPVSSMATADFAAVCALAYRVYKKFDTEFADKLLSAAEKSAEWLEANPDFAFDNPKECTTGGYGEWRDEDNRFWAYAELFAVTKNEAYHDKMKHLLELEIQLTQLGYGSVAGLGVLAYLTCGHESCEKDLLEIFRNAYTSEAEWLAYLADKNGYTASMNLNHFGWGSNMNLMKHGMIFAIATVFGKKDYSAYAQAQLDVLMGVNALGISYVTGNGYYRSNYPHLRPSAADGIEECIPGMVVGGPNQNPIEPTARDYIPVGTPPMKSYVDREEFYSLNEITIYWNSPVVFTMASLLK